MLHEVGFDVLRVNLTLPPVGWPRTNLGRPQRLPWLPRFVAEFPLDRPVPPLQMSFGFRSEHRQYLLWPLLGLLLVPVLVGLGLMFVSLSPAALRRFRWLTLLIWPLWMTVVAVLRADGVLQWMLGLTGEPFSMTVAGLAYVLPPLFVHVSLGFVIDTAGRRSLGLVGREWWSVLGDVFSSLGGPMVFVAVLLSVELAPRWGTGPVVLLASAVVISWLLLLVLTIMGVDPKTQAVPEGPLREDLEDRALALGARTPSVIRVPLRLLPAARSLPGRSASVIVVEELEEGLPPDEHEALLTWQLAHRSASYRRRALLVRLAAVVSVIFWPPVLMMVSLHLEIAARVMFGSMVAMLGQRWLAHRAVDESVEALGDAQPLADGFAHTLALGAHPVCAVPVMWRLYALTDGLGLLGYLERRHGVTPGDLVVPDLPAIQRRVFTAEVKSRAITRASWRLILVMVATPILALQALPSELSGFTLALLAGSATWLAVVAASMFPLAGMAQVRRQLKERLGGRGLYVGYSLDPEPRAHDGLLDADMGFLELEAERLEVQGERGRFAIPRHAVTRVRLGDGVPSWVALPRVYVEWKEGERQGTLQLRPGDATVRYRPRTRGWPETSRPGIGRRRDPPRWHRSRRHPSRRSRSRVGRWGRA